MSGVHDEMDGRKDVGSAVLRLDAPCLSWSGAMVNVSASGGVVEYVVLDSPAQAALS